MNKFAIFFSSIIIFLSLCGCSHKSFILSRKNHDYNYHIVKSGDTLHSIAKQYNVRLERLVKINNIKVPHTLYDGQQLNLPDSNIQKNYNVLLKKQVYAAKKTPKIECNYNQSNSVKHSNNNKWGWPAHGTIIKHFVNFGPDQGNGIDIIGKKGDPIMSIANGKVVYSGNNLRGYGNLIIIKHNQDFLSAYAHNDKILVKEQQEVVKGQKIATMGDSEANKVVLHFEIRYKGKPIDPLKLLMKRHHD